MAFDRGQHVDEAAKDVRAYRFAFIGTGHRNDLVDRNTEVIPPKPNKTPDEADLRGDGGFDADFGLERARHRAVRGRLAMRRADRLRSRRLNRRPAPNRTDAMRALLRVSGRSS